MNLKQGVSIALMVVGVVLLVMGMNAMESFGSDVSRFFTGTPTDRSLWLVCSGVAALIIGASGIMFWKEED